MPRMNDAVALTKNLLRFDTVNPPAAWIKGAANLA